MKKKKILVIDDSDILCNTLKARLEANGPYTVRAEIKGNLTLSAAKNFLPDLIMLDILMPDIDGVSVAMALKKDPSIKGIPIIFLTAIAQNEDVQEQGNTFGGYHVLPKSIKTSDLIKCITENLNK